MNSGSFGNVKDLTCSCSEPIENSAVLRSSMETPFVFVHMMRLLLALHLGLVDIICNPSSLNKCFF